MGPAAKLEWHTSNGHPTVCRNDCSQHGCQVEALAAKPPLLKLYTNDELQFQIKVPTRWKAVRSKSAVAFKAPSRDAGASLGVLKSAQQGLTFDQAARKEYKRQKRPKAWDQRLVKIGERPAVEVETNADPAGKFKLLMYYVEAPEGYYLIQCLAPVST